MMAFVICEIEGLKTRRGVFLLPLVLQLSC